MGQGNRDKPEGLGKGSRVPGAARWCSLCLVVRVSKGMRGGGRVDGGTGPLRSFLGSGLAGGRPDARSTSTPPSSAWVSSTGKMSPSAGPPSRTRRDNAGTCTPEVDAAGASGGPSYRAPRKS